MRTIQMIKNKRLLSLLLLFSLVGCGEAADAQQSLMPQISVSGNAEIVADTDEATNNLILQTQSAESAGAKAESDRRLNAFLDELENLGISEEQVTAASLNISAQYDYQNRQQRFIGFQATRSISVDITDLDMLHPVLDTAISHNVDGIQGINYRSSREDQLKAQARAAAIEDSQQKAAELAEAYGAQLGPVYNINYHSGQIVRPEFAMASDMAVRSFSAESAVGRFIPGDIRFTDSIQVVFDLITH